MRPKRRGFEKVDAYLIPKKEAGAYKRRRKKCRKLALAAMKTFAKTAGADFAGSQDGEAIVGMNEKGEYVGFIHLDPDGVNAIEQAAREGTLVQMLKGQ